jgi:NifU-like protein involved in Fe-S cluster formation
VTRRIGFGCSWGFQSGLCETISNHMSAEIYSGRVLELAADIPHVGTLADPQGSATKVARLCGSQIHIDVVMANNVVAEFAIEPKACALGQASASVLARNIIGTDRANVAAARDSFRKMLKENGAPPEGLFWELRYLAPVADYPPRHASTLLAFDAALEAIDQALGKKSQS